MTEKQRSLCLSWTELNDQITSCRRCPRLIDHCQKVARDKRRSYLDWDYWGRPVPNFGPKRISQKTGLPLLIVGLAPGAHGANRTGRMFTGDRSGDWLYRSMFRAGFANQPTSVRREDRLRITGCLITAVCHCAPPDNRPSREEETNCRPFLNDTISICRPKVFLALGGLAWKAICRYAIESAWIARPQPKFGHAAEVTLHENCTLLGSYHPSQQNTFTGRLTEAMLDDVFARARQLVDN